MAARRRPCPAITSLLRRLTACYPPVMGFGNRRGIAACSAAVMFAIGRVATWLSAVGLDANTASRRYDGAGANRDWPGAAASIGAPVPDRGGLMFRAARRR